MRGLYKLRDGFIISPRARATYKFLFDKIYFLLGIKDVFYLYSLSINLFDLQRGIYEFTVIVYIAAQDRVAAFEFEIYIAVLALRV